jgi:predicted nucleic acid-binding protein
MICIDTTVLIDEFRSAGNPAAPVFQALMQHANEELIVPSIAAGEFLCGAVLISEERAQQALGILQRRRVIAIDLTIAEHYGRIAAHLRSDGKIQPFSHNDIWIAATARASGSRLLTRNQKHFAGVPLLELIGY